MKDSLIVLSLALTACGSSVVLDDELAANDAISIATPMAHQPGTLDTTFGVNGIARVSFGADDDGLFRAMDVVHGKIVATGFGVGGLGAISMTTIRLDADGTIDPTWNDGKLIHTGFGHSGSGDDAEAVATARQADGRSLIIGFNHDSGSIAPCPCTQDIAVARFSLIGGPGGVDFGTNGLATVDLGGTEDVHAGLVLADNAIIAAGAQDGQLMVARLAPDGQLDTAFAAPLGFDRVVHGTASEADDAVLDHHGRLVVAGTFTVDNQTELNLIRYRANGTHDSRFGTAGEVVVPSTASEHTVALRTSGNKLVLGSGSIDAGASSLRVRRFTADGTLDTTFGTMGVAEVSGAPPLDLVVLSDGRIVLLTADSQLVRLTRHGALDTRFGPAGTGKQPIFFGDSGVPGGLQVYNDHQLLVSGGDDGGSPGPGTFGVVERIWL